MSKIISYFLPFLLVLSSCNEEETPDPALVSEFEMNKLEIQKLDLTVDKIERKIERSRIDDPTPELENLKEKVESERKRKAELQQEVRALEDEKAKAERELAEYQKKYPIQ